MKIKSLLLLLCVALSSTVYAQKSVELSVCAETQYTSCAITAQKDTYYAVYIPEEVAQRYVGATINTVEFCTAYSNPTQATAFISESLTTTDFLASASTTKFAAKGWNTLTLDKGYEITGKAFYIGVHDYNVNAGAENNYVVPIDAGPAVAGRNFFYDNSSEGDGQWHDFANTSLNYNVMLRAIATGDNLPAYDMALTGISAKSIIMLGSGVDVEFGIKNNATETITSYTLKYTIDGEENSRTIKVNNGLANNRSMTRALGSYAFDTAGSHTIEVTVCDPNGEPDCNMADNTLRTVVNVFDPATAYERTSLIEAFTGQDCGNCPGGHATLHNAINNVEDGEKRVIMMSHHSGYYPDEFTNPLESAYEWFYASPDGSTYAPAYMIDRAFVGGSTGSGAATGPAHYPSSQTSVIAEIHKRLAEAAYVDIKVDGKCDLANGTVDFVVSGNSLFDEYDSAPRLNVWFIEDGLIGRQANGGTKYEHNGVMRTSLTGTWGEPINVHDGKFSYNFNVNLGETTLKKPANGWILAFLSNFDATNVNNCEVLNASRIYLKDMNGNVDGIDTVGSNGGAMQSVAVYGIDGRQQSGMQRGINIVRQQRVDGSYETVKVLR